MEINTLIEWNPWWENKDLIKKFMGKPRLKYDSLLNSIKIGEITIITGVRRSGKTTLMYQMINNLLNQGISPEQILFVNFDDKKLINNSLEEIYEAYIQKINYDKKSYIFFDEIHRKANWESWIRKKYDQKEEIKFTVSGSCSYLLKKEYSTLLTGRNLTFEVFPLDFREFLNFKNLNIDNPNILTQKTKLLVFKYLDEYLNIGGYPEIVLKPAEYKTLLLKQYFDDILYKDIIDRYNLNSQKSRDLALYLITNFTNNVSLRNLRNILGLSYDTIKEYLHHYKEAFLFFTLDYFSYSFKEQKTRASKIYCIDNGLRNSVAFKFSKDYGRLAENLVFIELKRRNKGIYYWKNKYEVDFVIKEPNLIAINVTFTDETPEREIKALLEFKDKFKNSMLMLITKNTEKIQDNIKFIPLWKWLLIKEN
jgi:hypothetical protein